MAVGPLQLLLITFPHGRFDGEVLPELGALRTHGSVRIIDLVLVSKDAGGRVAALPARELPGVRPPGRVLSGLLSAGVAGEPELRGLVAELPAPGAGAIALLEHRWAAHLGAALRRVGGDLVGGGLVRSPELRGAVLRQEGSSAPDSG